MNENFTNWIDNYNKLNERAKLIFDNCIKLPPNSRGYYDYMGFSIEGNFIVIKYDDVCYGECTQECENIPADIFFSNNPVEEYQNYQHEQNKNSKLKHFKFLISNIDTKIKNLLSDKETIIKNYKEFLIKNNYQKELEELKEWEKNSKLKHFKFLISNIDTKIKNLLSDKETIIKNYKEFLIKNNYQKELEELKEWEKDNNS